MNTLANMDEALRARRDALAAQLDEASAVWQERQHTLAQAEEAQTKRQAAIAAQTAQAAESARERITAGEGEVDDATLAGDLQSFLLTREAQRAQTAIDALRAQVAEAQQPVMAIGRQLADVEFQLKLLEQQQQAAALQAEFDDAVEALMAAAAKIRAHNRHVTERVQQHNISSGGQLIPTSAARVQASGALCLPGAVPRYRQQEQQDLARKGVALLFAGDLITSHVDEDSILAALR